jgi:hypothetical protein
MPKPNDIRGEDLDHKTSLTLPRFTEVSVPSPKIERSWICVLWVSIVSLSISIRF